MTPTVTDDASRVTGDPVTGSCGTRLPSLGLAWAITIGEAILWGALAWVFADYWLMLPVRYRWWGIVVLAGLAAIGLIRLARFYRRLRRRNNAAPETRFPGQRSM